MRLALRRRDPARLVALLGVLLLLGAGPAARAADEIGIYWDEALTQTDIVQPDVFVPLTGYLVIRDPGVGGGILGWECRVTVDGPGTLTNWSLAGQAINAATPPDFAVGLAAPLPPGSSTAVATFTAFVTGPGPVEISLGPIYFASLPGPRVVLPREPQLVDWRRPVADVEGFLDELRASLAGVDLGEAMGGLRDDGWAADQVS